MHANNVELGRNVIRQEAEALQVLADTLDTSFDEALQSILDCEGRLIITGMGKSGHIGKKIAATLSSTGTPSFFLHPAEASHGDLGVLTKKDVVLAISNSGESHELADIIHFVTKNAIKLIAITKNKVSTLGKNADICLLLPKEREACPLGTAPTSSTTMTLALGDALAMTLLQMRGFSAEDFHEVHPGGALGANLVSIKDIMQKGDALPLIILDDNKKIGSVFMPEVLIEMTQKHLGCVVLVSSEKENTYTVEGLITDGDLRRHMSSDLLEKKACEIMTKNPSSIQEDLLATKALQLMNEKSITSLLVLNKDQKLTGIIHMHDCLRAGV